MRKRKFHQRELSQVLEGLELLVEGFTGVHENGWYATATSEGETLKSSPAEESW